MPLHLNECIYSKIISIKCHIMTTFNTHIIDWRSFQSNYIIFECKRFCRAFYESLDPDFIFDNGKNKCLIYIWLFLNLFCVPNIMVMANLHWYRTFTSKCGNQLEWNLWSSYNFSGWSLFLLKTHRWKK